MKTLLFVISILILSACATPPKIPDAGEATYSKTTATDGTVNETFTISAPQQGSGASTAQVGDLQIKFAKSYEWEMPEIPNATPQNMMYGVGLACILLGVALIGIGKHFKLGGLASITGVGIIGLAVTIEQLGEQIALMGAVGLLAFAAFLGWALWRDYKDDGSINMSVLK